MPIKHSTTIINDSLAAFGRINRFEALRQWPNGVCCPESQNLAPPQQPLDCSSQAGPEFNLSRDGPLGHLRGQSSIENEGIRKLDGLAHASKVAKRYRTC